MSETQFIKDIPAQCSLMFKHVDLRNEVLYLSYSKIYLMSLFLEHMYTLSLCSRLKIYILHSKNPTGSSA